ncbi:MAG: DUF1294 domain-containing protein [Clostridia bacterium]|nr:DUF1294 domain-containing protein [Clostridia bacterium]
MIAAYLVVLLIMNILTLVLYSYDKVAAATPGRVRIPVYVLLMSTALGGAIGAFASMFLYRHKTQKLYFRIPIIFCLIVQIIIGLLCVII